MRSGRIFPASRATRGALALCVGALLALSGCGGDDDEGRPIPANDANRMISLIERADQQSADGTCNGAKAKVREAQDVLEGVPRRVDPDVRQGIADGLDRMHELIESECQRPERTDTETTPTETTVTETVPTETTPTETTPTPTPTTPTETTPAPTETTPVPQPTTTTPGTGGTPPGEGAAAPAEGGDG